jgi:cytochrome P450
MAGSGRAVILMVPALRRDLGPLTPYRRFIRNLASADALVHAQIAHRRRRNGEPRRDDVLALLLDARDEHGQPLSDGELRDELMTLLLAGHETTATALCWAFERVLATPRVHAQLRAELDTVLAGKKLAPDHLPRLEYLEATITEVLRLRPVVPLVGRKLRAPLALKSWLLPAGAIVAPSIYLTHRRRDVYPSPRSSVPSASSARAPTLTPGCPSAAGSGAASAWPSPSTSSRC